jgi:hypothetical protein
MEIESHIRKLFRIYEEDEDFFEEYVAGVLEHEIDNALECFRDLVKQAQILKPKEWENEQRMEREKTKLPKFKIQSKFKPYDRRRKSNVLGELPKAVLDYANRRSGTG